MTSHFNRFPLVNLKRRALLSFFGLGLVAISFLPPAPTYYVNAQEPVKVRPLQAEFLAEPGSPIDVTLAKTELDLDPFDIPLASRIYIDYKNISDRPVSAVKFRIRFTDESGKDRGTFHAPDMASLGPGMQRSQKWRHERVDPRSTQIKVRALQVKFADGSSWQSTKMSELAQPPTSGAIDSQDSQNSQVQGGGAPFGNGGGGGAPQTAPSGTFPPPASDVFPPPMQAFPPPMTPPAQPQQAPPNSSSGGGASPPDGTGAPSGEPAAFQ